MMPHLAGRAGGKGPCAGPFAAYRDIDTGLIQGTALLTLDGEIPVEYVSPGDKVITRDAGISRILHIERVNRAVHLIAFNDNALSRSRPVRHTHLAGDQMVLIRDEQARTLFGSERALVAARGLCDQDHITDLGLIDTTLHQIFCNEPHIFYADGLELGTADAGKARGAVLHAA